MDYIYYYYFIFCVSSASGTALLSRYPLKITPYPILDILGRSINLYEILVHFTYVYQFINMKTTDTVYGGRDNQMLLESVLASAIDYFGWICIISRLNDVSFTTKVLANSHVTAIIMAIYDMDTFQTLFIRRTSSSIWNLWRIGFVLHDAISRTYYQFNIL